MTHHKNIMIRLHECCPNLYYLHSSMYNQHDWSIIQLVYDNNVNKNSTSKQTVKRWLGITNANADINVTKHQRGIAIYCNSNVYPMFFLSSIDYTLYYFFIDIYDIDLKIIKSIYHKLFNYIHVLEDTNLTTNFPV